MTLTQAALLTRRGIISFAILTVLSIIGSVGYNIWRQYYLAHLPPVVEKPEMKFGTLPDIQFLPSNVSSSNYSYSIDTITGGLPETPKMIKIYFIPRSGVSLMAPERSRHLAEKLGFSNGPEILSPTEYKFTDNNGGSVTIDLTTGNFEFERESPRSFRSGNAEVSQSASSSSKVNNKNLPDQTQLAQMFKNYLQTNNLLTEELSNGRSNVVFGTISAADSDSADVSIWPSDFENTPIVTSTFKHGLVKATVAKGFEEDDQFTKVNYTYWKIDKSTYSTYPLKTTDQAFSDLKNGKGFIGIEPPKPQVSISSVSLAYFQARDYSPYLQPVFVFEGPNFAAVVPAVDSTYRPT